MVRSKENLIGAWAFLIGVILATIIGLFQSYFGTDASNFIYSLLVVLGMIVGLLNVADKDAMTFLLASLALVIVSGIGKEAISFVSNIAAVLGSLGDVLSALLVMFVPATIIVALKAVFAIAKN